MNLTVKKLKQLAACEGGIEWLKTCGETEVRKVCKKLLSENRFGWANWLVSRLLKRDDKTKYAIFAASLVLEIYEKKYPNDVRPRNAILATKRYLKNKTIKNRENCISAAHAAAYAADAAHAAAFAAFAAYAAYAYAAAAYAAYAADTAADAAYAIKPKIINYGLRLIYKRVRK